MTDERNGFFSSDVTNAFGLILEAAGVAMVIFLDGYIADAGMLVLSLGVIVGMIPHWREP